MNTFKQSHIFCKAKARRQCFFLIMCFHLVLGDVPGPCRHSVTTEHVLNVKRLIDNQLLQNDCSITYKFMERHSLSKVCYVKAAFPQILELLKTNFQYVQSSDNYQYVSTLKTLVFNIYSQKCIPEINEEIENDPVRFAKDYNSSPREALGKIKEVIQLYMQLMTENNKPVDWNCEEEYAEDYPESTTALAQSTGETECHCFGAAHGASQQVPLPDTSQYDDHLQPPYLQLHSSRLSELAGPPLGTTNPWDHVSVNNDYNSHRRPVEADSSSSPAVKDEQEEATEDISSSKFPAFPGTSHLGATPTSPTSFDGKDDGHKDPSVSWHWNHLDSIATAPVTSESLGASAPFTLSAESVRGTDVFASRATSEKTSSATVAFIPRQNHIRVSDVARGQSLQRTSFLDPSHVMVSPSAELADNPTTAIISVEPPIRSTPTKPEETTAIVLTKRSVGPSVEGSQSSLPTDNQLIQNWIAEDYPSASEISQDGQKTSATIGTDLLPRRTVEDTSRALSGVSVGQLDPLAPTPALKHESVPIRTTGEKLESTEGPAAGRPTDLMDSDSPDRDSGKVVQNRAQGGPHTPYKIAFIAASLCGGLLLLIILYCFRKQTKLKALLLLQSSNVKENQRLTSCSKDIEMQHSEITEWSRLGSL